jgi:cell division septation protein DedD
MDIALKQRLVGASVLVALGVIFIPMLLDGPANSGGTRETVRIPTPPDHRFESRLLPVDPAGSAVPDTDQPPAQEPEAGSVDTAPVQEVDSRVINSDPPIITTTEPAPPATQVQETTATAVPQTEASGTWVLQLGSFGNAANAARLVESLQRQELNGYQEKIAVGDKTMYRVRVGSWSSKDLAAQAGVSVSTQFPSLDISVRRISSTDGAAPAATSAGTGWMVQVGSFAQQDNALVLRDKLRAGGFAAALENGANNRYKVLVGPALSRAGAESTRDRLKQEFAINGIILSHP